MQDAHFLGEGKNHSNIYSVLSSVCNGWSHALLTSKIQTLQTIIINIFLINSSTVLSIEVFDCSTQTNPFYPTISQEIICFFNFFCCPSNCISNWRWQGFFLQSNFNISASTWYVQNRIQMTMNLTSIYSEVGPSLYTGETEAKRQKQILKHAAASVLLAQKQFQHIPHAT